MVGYDEKKKAKNLSEFWKGVAGTLSGTLTRLICQPLDVLKIRFQFSCFELSTKVVYTAYHGENNKTVTHFICGGLSGGVATAATMPFDTIRTRLVGQGEPKVYRGILHALSSMLRQEGVLSLYKGLSPNLIQIAPHTGMQFGFFHLFSNLYRSVFQPGSLDEKLPAYANLAAGSIAGFLAKAGIYPFDLAKKRLQVQGFEIARSKFGEVKKYNGLRHYLIVTWREEGIFGLYKGFLPSTLKAMLTTGLIFAFYEEITDVLVDVINR